MQKRGNERKCVTKVVHFFKIPRKCTNEKLEERSLRSEAEKEKLRRSREEEAEKEKQRKKS
ncbi:MAG: hypothetical protein IJH41_00605 [Eubacterium sp.]|nr:hypothetical protein [Eubacterium sp.]